MNHRSQNATSFYRTQYKPTLHNTLANHKDGTKIWKNLKNLGDGISTQPSISVFWCGSRFLSKMWWKDFKLQLVKNYLPKFKKIKQSWERLGKFNTRFSVSFVLNWQKLSIGRETDTSVWLQPISRFFFFFFFFHFLIF